MIKSNLTDLSYISAGTIPPNPAEMLDSKEMRNFLKQMRDKFDLIILDSPPVIAVTDSEILTSMVDGTITCSFSRKYRDRYDGKISRTYQTREHSISWNCS